MNYIQLHTPKLSLHDEILFIDILENNYSESIFEPLMWRNHIPYKIKSTYVINDYPYAITIVKFRPKYLNDIIRIIDETYNNALILGYSGIDRYIDMMDKIRDNLSQSKFKQI